MIDPEEAAAMRARLQDRQRQRAEAAAYNRQDAQVLRLFRQGAETDQEDDGDPFADVELLDPPLTEDEEWIMRAKTAAEYALLTTGLYIALIILDWVRAMYR